MAQTSVGHVFMSYSRRDEAAMRHIATFLRNKGINVWVDNEKLVPGTPIWEVEIEKAIKSASAVVVILSPDSKNSEWVRREISLADQYRTRIFPVLVRGNEESSITLRLITRQYIDIRQEESNLGSLSTELSKYLKDLEAQERRVREETERLAREKAEREAAEKATREKVEREAAEKTAREKAEQEAAEKAARKKAEREAMEKAIREKLEREYAERNEREKAEQESKRTLKTDEQTTRQLTISEKKWQIAKQVILSLFYWIIVFIIGWVIWGILSPTELKSLTIFSALSGFMIGTIIATKWQRRQFGSNWLRLAVIASWTIGMTVVWALADYTLHDETSPLIGALSGLLGTWAILWLILEKEVRDDANFYTTSKSVLKVRDRFIWVVRIIVSALLLVLGLVIRDKVRAPTQFILENHSPALRLGGNPDYVRYIAFSPDGSMLVSNSLPGGVQIWSVDSGVLVHTFDVDPENNWEFALSSDGQRFATAHNVTKLYSSSDGTLLKTIDDYGSSIAFSPNNELIAVGASSSIELWRVSDGVLLKTLKNQECIVTSIVFSPDGSILASGSRNANVCLWRFSDGSIFRTLAGHEAIVNGIAFSPDSQIIASGSNDHTVRLWRVSDGNLIFQYEVPNSDFVKSVAFAPDGKTIAIGTYDGEIYTFQVSDGTTLQTFRGHKGIVGSIAFSPNGSLLASGSADGTIRLWGVTQLSVPQSSPTSPPATGTSADLTSTATLTPHQTTVQPFTSFVLTHISQHDPAWESVKLGFSDYTIGEWGDAVTSLAMLVSGYGFPETPETLNTKLKAVGGFDAGSVIWSSVTKIYPRITFKNLVICETTPAPLSEIDAAIEAGNPVIAAIDSSPIEGNQTKWVVLYAKQDNDYLMLDPDLSTKEASLIGRYGSSGSVEQMITAIVFYEYVTP